MSGIHVNNQLSHPIKSKSNDGVKQISFDRMHDELSRLYRNLNFLYSSYLPWIAIFKMKGSSVAKGMDLSIDYEDEGKKEIKFWFTPEELYIKINEKVMHLKNADHVMRQYHKKTGNENNKKFFEDESTYLSNLINDLEKIVIHIQNEKKMSRQNHMKNAIKDLFNQANTTL